MNFMYEASCPQHYTWMNLLVWVLKDGHQHLSDVAGSQVGHPRPGHCALLVQRAVVC